MTHKREKVPDVHQCPAEMRWTAGEEAEADGAVRPLTWPPSSHPAALLYPARPDQTLGTLPGSRSDIHSRHHEVVGSPVADAGLRGDPVSLRKLDRKS